ncbi:MAG: hypothetical protein C5B54_09045 [Acidobacteria bacterium]|nr:MAG: hypothetical protein C5B54_09045 [Acidobacteriota bacterium]
MALSEAELLSFAAQITLPFKWSFQKDPVRWILLGGLIVHKLVWEILKRKYQTPIVRAAEPSSLKRILKLIKVMALFALIVQTLFLDAFPISNHPETMRIIGVIVYFFGLVTAIVARLNMGKNWIDLEDYQVLPEQSLVTNGLYSLIRHPIYAGDFLLLVGLELALNSWLVLGALLLIPILYRQAFAEEELLLKVFPEYEAYRARTKRFIPFIL